MTVNILIQIDKLVQLLESPVFTCMCSPFDFSAIRLPLTPMINCQTSASNYSNPNAFPTSTNASTASSCSSHNLQPLQPSRTVSTPSAQSAISTLPAPHRQASPGNYNKERTHPFRFSRLQQYQQYLSSDENSSKSAANTHCASRAPNTASAVSTFERPNRIKTRDEGGVRWVELLEKFRTMQERARRPGRPGLAGGEGGMMPPPVPEKERRALGEAAAPEEQRAGPVGVGRVNGQPGSTVPVRQGPPATMPQQQQQTQQTQKHKSGLGIGRFASGVAGRRSKR